MHRIHKVIFALLCFWLKHLASKRTVTIVGATSGVGQLIAKQCIQSGFAVNAVSRNIESAKGFDNLKLCNFFEADTRNKQSLKQPGMFTNCESVVISVGTTAFPTKKWEKGLNDPKVACLDSVANIISEIERIPISTRPKRIYLVSSIGVERTKQFPFSLLNSYKVLDYKRASELLLIERATAASFEAIVVRPGRLVGAPFTNTDLAKLLQLTQGSNKGIKVDVADVLAGDMERNDVATAILQLMDISLSQASLVFSIVNSPNPQPTRTELTSLLTELQFSGYGYSDRTLL